MKALFVIDTFFPYGVAISGRIRCFCRLFGDLGYEVHVITLHSSEKNLRPGQIVRTDYCTFEKTSAAKSRSSLSTFFADKSLIKAVENYFKRDRADILFSTGCSKYFDRLSAIAHRQNIPYFVEQCEWQDVSNFTFKKFDPRYRKIAKLRAGGYKNASGVISISRLLDDHYRAQGIPSIRIPTILDVRGEALPERKSGDGKINIVYTGSPGTSKEYLRPVIENLAQNAAYREKVVFHVYGPSRKTVVANVGDESLLLQAGESVVLHGRVPQSQIAEILASADYQLFVRPDRRSSNAGFPTKLGESMAVGTPVIANDTGDIGLYLKDGENGFLLDGNKTENVKKAFDKLIATDADRYAEMRRHARATAEDAFDYRTYLKTAEEFFYRNGSGKQQS